MNISTANLTVYLVEKLKMLGYKIEIDSDNEVASVYKDRDGILSNDPVPTQA